MGVARSVGNRSLRVLSLVAVAGLVTVLAWPLGAGRAAGLAAVVLLAWKLTLEATVSAASARALLELDRRRLEQLQERSVAIASRAEELDRRSRATADELGRLAADVDAARAAQRTVEDGLTASIERAEIAGERIAGTVATLDARVVALDARVTAVDVEVAELRPRTKENARALAEHASSHAGDETLRELVDVLESVVQRWRADNRLAPQSELGPPEAHLAAGLAALHQRLQFPSSDG